MRRRVTFIQRHDSSFDHNQTDLTSESLSIRNLDAAREDRFSVPADELPSELVQVLNQCYQLHIRWITEKHYHAPVPFSSRLSPGLHVLFTSSAPEAPNEELCPLLRRVFGDGVDCSTPEISFTVPPIPREKSLAPPAFQFHTLLPSLHNLAEFVQGKFCGADEGCRNHAASIVSANSIDISYDGESRMMALSGLWSSPEGGWTEDIKRGTGTNKVEVGLLGCDKARDPVELKAGGLLAVVGDDKKLKPTLFSFPSRHHSLTDDATYTVSFPPPTGLHPTMTISLPRSSLNPPQLPQDASCSIYTYLTLPRGIFGDKYQLSTTDPLFLQSHNLVSLHAVSGETDLEAPDWVVPRWGSSWLFELATPAGQDLPEHWNVTIPLHLRYLRPSESGYRPSAVPWPVVFWACTTAVKTDMGGNPFDRVNLGWESLFRPQTTFYQLHPSGAKDDRLVEELRVPVLKLKESDSIFQAKVIELSTVVVITLGLVWVLWKLGLVVRSRGGGAGIDKGKKKE